MKYKITITDKTVEIAAIHLYEWKRQAAPDSPTWDDAPVLTRANYRDVARVVLNAAAPQLGVRKVTK